MQSPKIAKITRRLYLKIGRGGGNYELGIRRAHANYELGIMRAYANYELGIMRAYVLRLMLR